MRYHATQRDHLKCVCVAGSVRVVRGEGMPHYRNPFEKGDLFIKFEVQFPENKWISPEKLSVSVHCVQLSISAHCETEIKSFEWVFLQVFSKLFLAMRPEE